MGAIGCFDRRLLLSAGWVVGFSRRRARVLLWGWDGQGFVGVGKGRWPGARGG